MMLPVSGPRPLFTHQIRSDQIRSSVVSDSLRPHESQHARPPCPSPTPGVHWDSRPSGQWCHPAISSSVVPFSSCPQSLPASQSFPMSQLFAWGGQSTGVSALASFLPKKSQGWSSSEWTGWISLQSKGLLNFYISSHVKGNQKATMTKCSWKLILFSNILYNCPSCYNFNLSDLFSILTKIWILNETYTRKFIR